MLLSTASPRGLLNCAALPVPSLLPFPSPPASVVTTPAGVIVRILPTPSATYTVPTLSTAIPWGELNRAALPVPSVPPAVFARPANVVTLPTGVTLRIVWLVRSAT